VVLGGAGPGGDGLADVFHGVGGVVLAGVAVPAVPGVDQGLFEVGRVAGPRRWGNGPRARRLTGRPG